MIAQSLADVNSVVASAGQKAYTLIIAHCENLVDKLKTMERLANTYMCVCVLTLYISDVYSNDVVTTMHTPKLILLDGQIMLGGLFPMHEKGSGSQLCGAIKEDKGIQRVEAMLYALDRINADVTLLPGITLGAHILDTCLRDTYGLEQSLEFIKSQMNSLDTGEYQCRDGSTATEVRPSAPVVGVIGAAASPVSIMVANILRLFKVGRRQLFTSLVVMSLKSRVLIFMASNGHPYCG